MNPNNKIKPLERPTGDAFAYKQIELPNSGGLMVSNPFYTKNALERYRDRMTPEQIEEKNRILNEAKNTYIDAYIPNNFLTREQYISQQRQSIIDQSIENSNNRTLPTVPYVIIESEKDWKNRLENNINFLKLQLQQAIKYNDDELIEGYNNHIDSLNQELLKEYVPELCPGASCIYTATDNYGKKYRVSGNKTFRANPTKYGFQEISLDAIKPGDIIQDFTRTNNVPHHALTFIGYDNEGKARFNYSRGGTTESDNKKNALYPFF